MCTRAHIHRHATHAGTQVANAHEHACVCMVLCTLFTYECISHVHSHLCAHTWSAVQAKDKQATWVVGGAGSLLSPLNLLVLSWTESQSRTAGHVVAEFSSAPFRTKRRLCDSSELISFSFLALSFFFLPVPIDCLSCVFLWASFSSSRLPAKIYQVPGSFGPVIWARNLRIQWWEKYGPSFRELTRMWELWKQKLYLMLGAWT